jgi:hypothetical protein
MDETWKPVALMKNRIENCLGGGEEDLGYKILIWRPVSKFNILK